MRRSNTTRAASRDSASISRARRAASARARDPSSARRTATTSARAWSAAGGGAGAGAGGRGGTRGSGIETARIADELGRDARQRRRGRHAGDRLGRDPDRLPGPAPTQLVLEAHSRRLGRAGFGPTLELLLGQFPLALGPLARSGGGRRDLLGLVAAAPGPLQLLLEAANPLLGRGQVAHRLPGALGLLGARGELAGEVAAQGLLGVGPLLGDPPRALTLLQRRHELVAHRARVPQLVLQRIDPLRQLRDAAGPFKIRRLPRLLWLVPLLRLVRIGLECRLRAPAPVPCGPKAGEGRCGGAEPAGAPSPGAGTATGNGTITVPNCSHVRPSSGAIQPGMVKLSRHRPGPVPPTLGGSGMAG